MDSDYHDQTGSASSEDDDVAAPLQDGAGASMVSMLFTVAAILWWAVDKVSRRGQNHVTGKLEVTSQQDTSSSAGMVLASRLDLVSKHAVVAVIGSLLGPVCVCLQDC